MSSPVGEYLLSLRVPYEDIASATNNFASENLIEQGSGSSGNLYKGQLLVSGQMINIVACKFQLSDRFLKEMLMSFVLHQKNVACVVGLCDVDVDKLVVVKKHFTNGSLDKHLSGSTLSWLQRLQICVGIAKALSWLHFNDVMIENTYMIHGDIRSSKILLDDNWEPMLQGSKNYIITKRHQLHLTSEYKATLQYMDPAYETTGGLTHKSDVFSFGVVLFEVLFGRKGFISNEDKWYFARLARLYYEESRLDEMIDSDLRKQMDLQSLKVFSETAYFCLKEERQQRPDMKQIVRRLERVLELQKKHQSPLVLKKQSTVFLEGTSSCHLKGKNLDQLRIPLSDIKIATKNFSDTYCIGSGGYGKVYKAELNGFDARSSLVTRGMNEYEIFARKSNNTVAIKRIFSREDKQGEQGFLVEIEMLSNCKHPNIIPLFGFCDEGGEKILVYEYASNGSLDDYLGNDDNIINLTWAQRMQICLNIAHGLKYLHTSTPDKQKMIHRDIKSANILLDDNWVAKIADFGLSKLFDAVQQDSTHITCNIAGTEVYLDPEYWNTGRLKKASDIYSFGVVMFELLCGRLAYDKMYNEKGLPSIVRRRFDEGTLKEMVDPKLKEVDDNIFMQINKGFHQDSIDIFINIAYQCLAKTQRERPPIEVIIRELEKAFNLQKNIKNNLQISLEEIKFATRNFNDHNCIGEGMFWKLYKGELRHPNANRCTAIVVKRWDRKSPHGYHQFLRELEILSTRKHENIICLVGYCSEMDEKIIIYEHLSKGRLDKHLDNPSLTWMRRLKICIDVASALDFLHADDGTYELSMIHRDMKSSSILLDGDWKAKLSNLELSSKSWAGEEIQHAIDNAYSSLDYIDPNYKYGILIEQSDIYSLGVVLMEILCGRLAHTDGCDDGSQSLGFLAKGHYVEEKVDELVFKSIRDQIAPESLTTFQRIALQCLEKDKDDRPSARDVLEELKAAFEYQEDHEIWEPKLPRDYEQIIQMSKSSWMLYFDRTYKNLHKMLTKGILLQDGKVWFSLGSNGERNEMISAKFSYKNYRSHNWRSIPTSRFQKVAKMLDLSNLKTQIKTRTQFLRQGVNYGVFLVFKFCKTRKVSATPVYVNLKYKIGNETLQSYFATWRDGEWMMIELCRCFTHKEEVDFKVILESFSQYYCKSGAIYVEGIEFREMNNAREEQEKTEELNVVQREMPTDCKETSNRSHEGEKVFLLSEVNDKKIHFLSAKEALHDFSNVKFCHSEPLAQTRFKDVIVLLAQQVLHIKCKIQSNMLSPNSDYACYLVFMLSEKCCGLHCPVILRDLLIWDNKQTGLLYFRSPSLINHHNIKHFPGKREDGCMEVCVWEGSSNGKFNNGCLPLNLKLTSYEGTMSGLIVYGLEFRPI